QWFMSPDIARYMPAAAAAVLQLLLVAAVIGLWRLGEWSTARFGLGWTMRGGRGFTGEPGLKFAAMLGMTVLVLGFGALAALAI
ncbi:hypothetical protein, partial [Stenotrophomonas maltophilia]|uniref:hypothetical protein n=1 Tax=Stenotrophomonas maltophilia TaxID=40324 RepID=UPI0019533C6F